ncbi:MAG: esterase-like activity of phytase family protein [Oceanicaulis sp.]|nr:esterase-like activity of phytase family protein [Oceanicaulis sp.]
MVIIRHAFLAAALALAAACGAQAGDARNEERAVAIDAVSVPLYPDDPERRDAGQLTYRGGLVLTSPDPAFGGFSALELNEDGTRLLAVSDRGQWLVADIIHDADGAPLALDKARMAPLRDFDGAPFQGRWADAEGLAHWSDGVYLVSFERHHRVESYILGEDWSLIGSANATRLPPPPGAETLADNGSLEALAVQSGAAWVGVEYPRGVTGVHTVFRYDLSDPGAGATEHAIQLAPGFGLVAFAEPGDGQLIAVQRFWHRDIGNRIRISRISEAAILDPRNRPAGELLAEITPDMTVDNIEGAAVVSIDGRQRLYLISDDNFSATQRTLLMSFDLPE